MNRHLLQVLFFSISLIFSNSVFANNQIVNDDEKPVVLFVEFSFDANDMGLAIELLTEMQNQTYENEEGCISYDLLLSAEHPNTVFIYECYENKAAVDLHNKAPYFKEIVTKKLVPIIKTQNIKKLSPINDMGIAIE